MRCGWICCVQAGEGVVLEQKFCKFAIVGAICVSKTEGNRGDCWPMRSGWDLGATW